MTAPGGGAFLAGAQGRLLPPSLPFRYFGAAGAFQLAGWLALGTGAATGAPLTRGLSWSLAGLHCFTLGVLATTAVGASLQLLPVATRQGVGDPRWVAAVWWLLVGGIVALVSGMASAAPPLLVAGAGATGAALAFYAVGVARNLARARGMPVVVAHGWVALAALVVLVASGAALVARYATGAGVDRDLVRALHALFGAYGFMGMNALGLSYILVPMFALAAAPDDRAALAALAAALVGLVLAGGAVAGYAPRLLALAAVGAGVVACALHLRLMRATLARGMRRNLGRSFLLVKVGWVLLPASLGFAAVLALGVPLPYAPEWFGLALFGWLTTFLWGMLQRIVPFLASMHAAAAGGGPRRLPPTPSSLTVEPALDVHRAGHLAALALLAAALAAAGAGADRVAVGLVEAAALAGAVGAVGFLWFFAVALARMRRPPPPRGGRGALAGGR